MLFGYNSLFLLHESNLVLKVKYTPIEKDIDKDDAGGYHRL